MFILQEAHRINFGNTGRRGKILRRRIAMKKKMLLVGALLGSISLLPCLSLAADQERDREMTQMQNQDREMMQNQDRDMEMKGSENGEHMIYGEYRD